MGDLPMRALLALALAPALLSSSGPPRSHASVPQLLAPADLPIAEVLPPPPSDASSQHLAELTELASLERGRTHAELVAAERDNSKKDASIFAGAMGPWFELGHLPETATLMAMVRASEKASADRAKAYFKRPRPWVANPAIKACSREDEPLTSYPSGHTTMAFSMGAVLARLDPLNATRIMARAAEFGEHRLVCEVHYRSDVTAGQTLGLIVAERLMRNPIFQQQFVRARAELGRTGITTERGTGLAGMTGKSS